MIRRDETHLLVELSQYKMVSWVQLLVLWYLHGILFPIDGVLRARASVLAPVQVKLHGLVAVGQAST